MSGTQHRQVRRRRVIYIPGYDPMPPRRYRELYRKEGAAQAEISGYEIGIRARTGEGDFGWDVAAHMDGAKIMTQVDVLVWSDIVQGSMSNSIPATYWQMLRTAWIYVASGTLRRLMRMRKGPVIAALYPVGMLVGQLLLALLAWRLVLGALTWAVTPLERWIWGRAETWLDWPVWALGMAAGAAACVWLLRWFRAQDGRLFAYYLMHDYAHSAGQRGAYPPELETRLDEMRARVAAALRSDVDEVLVVGHSSGAHLGVSVLADLIRAGEVPKGGPALGFLSLGQVVPMVSFLPRAGRLRGDLRYLSTRPELTWIDVTAPGDGCAFALCDPVAVTGVAPEGKRWPLVISAAFTQTLSEARWRALRWRFFRLHFQYLCAFDRPGDYDYFRITAGPRTLAERFEGREPSRSRIDVAVSKYTSVAA